MPAQPSTMASAPSSRRAAQISALMRVRASLAASSSSSTGTSAARTRAQRLARPYFCRLCSIATTERDSVVMTLKRGASSAARWQAASPMPTTGASNSARAASRPVSSKQAMTWPAIAGSRAQAAAIASSMCGTAMASSKKPSIETGPQAALKASISVPACATARAVAAMRAVIDAVVFGLTMAIFMAKVMAMSPASPRPAPRCAGSV